MQPNARFSQFANNQEFKLTLVGKFTHQHTTKTLIYKHLEKT